MVHATVPRGGVGCVMNVEHARPSMYTVRNEFGYCPQSSPGHAKRGKGERPEKIRAKWKKARTLRAPMRRPAGRTTGATTARAREKVVGPTPTPLNPAKPATSHPDSGIPMAWTPSTRKWADRTRPDRLHKRTETPPYNDPATKIPRRNLLRDVYQIPPPTRCMWDWHPRWELRCNPGRQLTLPVKGTPMFHPTPLYTGWCVAGPKAGSRLPARKRHIVGMMCGRASAHVGGTLSLWGHNQNASKMNLGP